MDSAKLVEQLHALGVRPGGVLVVHTAFSKVAPVDGGPVAVIDALLAALGQNGTLVMPSMSDDDERPFDPTRTPCAGMGVVADTFWRMPGVSRSDSPHSFAAIGAHATRITGAHPVEVPHGLDSPIGRVFELNGQVLLLGTDHSSNTTVHLAENLAGARYGQHKYATITGTDGSTRRCYYFEIDHCCENFARLDGWLEARGLQQRGVVGHAPARLMRSRDVIEVALAQLLANETVFLHPRGACAECDLSRAGN